MVAGVVAAVVGLCVLLPRLAGLDETWGRIRDGDPGWIAVSAVLELGSYAGYVLLLRGVVGRVGDGNLSWREGWRLTLAGVAASRLLATAGAGGIALTGWALARMGMSARTVATRLRDRWGGGGTVGALVAFGEPAGLALAAVLTYRAFAFWLPTLPGAVAYVQLTRRLGHPKAGEPLPGAVTSG